MTRRFGLAARAALLAAVLFFGAGSGCSDEKKAAPCPTLPDQPLVLDVGSNNRSIVMAFGDSISDGQDSTDGLGYRDELEKLIAADGRLPAVRVVNEGIGGTLTQEGATRFEAALARHRPALVIILYGTNDALFNLPQSLFAAELLPTTTYLRQMALTARARQTLVLLSTVPPVCGSTRQNQRENIATLNEKIRALGRELNMKDAGVMYADPWDDFLRTAPPDGCALISDVHRNHPNDAGYATLARTFYQALEDVAW